MHFTRHCEHEVSFEVTVKVFCYMPIANKDTLQESSISIDVRNLEIYV
jgi:hypothetical protein